MKFQKLQSHIFLKVAYNVSTCVLQLQILDVNCLLVQFTMFKRLSYVVTIIITVYAPPTLKIVQKIIFSIIRGHNYLKTISCDIKTYNKV